jgi:hypothetical protein
LERWSTFSISSAIGVPVVTCGAGRLVGEHAGQDFHRVRLLPLGGEARLAGPALVEIGWMSASLSGMRGGQPSTTQPIAGPWLSPKVVTRNRWPKVLNDMHFRSVW